MLLNVSFHFGRSLNELIYVYRSKDFKVVTAVNVLLNYTLIIKTLFRERIIELQFNYAFQIAGRKRCVCLKLIEIRKTRHASIKYCGPVMSITCSKLLNIVPRIQAR